MPGPGDEVCVLLGYDRVILLRPHISGRRQVEGRAYVYGLMSTEGVLGTLPKGWETKQWSGDGASEWVYKDSVKRRQSHLLILDPVRCRIDGGSFRMKGVRMVQLSVAT